LSITPHYSRNTAKVGIKHLSFNLMFCET